MTSRKLFVVPLLTLAIVLACSATAFATYGGSDGVAKVEPSKLGPGGTITITASGFMPISGVTITLYSDPVDLGTSEADTAGDVSAPVTIPADTEPGSHTVEVSGVDPSGNPYTVSAALEIEGEGDSDTGSLPTTGAAIIGLVGAAVLLVTVGGVLTRARKRALSA